MRPLVSYYGGKQRLASTIVKLLPPHTVYVEPYCGGASVLFAKPHPRPSNNNHYREVLNDHDERLMTVYRVCQQPASREALQERLTYTPYGRSAYREAQAVLRQWDAHDPLTQAWALMVKIMQSFANIEHGGWRTGIFGRNQAATWANYRQALPLMMDRLSEVHLECDEALAVIRRWDSPQTVVFCDPPYVGANQGPYKGYTEADLIKLVACLETCQASFVLSGYAHPAIPTHWPCVTVDAYCSASGVGKTNGHARTRKATAAEMGERRRVEHLWVVDRSAHVRPELQFIHQRSLFEESL